MLIVSFGHQRLWTDDWLQWELHLTWGSILRQHHNRHVFIDRWPSSCCAVLNPIVWHSYILLCHVAYYQRNKWNCIRILQLQSQCLRDIFFSVFFSLSAVRKVPVFVPIKRLSLGLAITIRPLFQCLICVERYLAVIHPVIFLKYKPIRYKWYLLLLSGC